MALSNEAARILSTAGVGGVPGSTETWWIFERELQDRPNTAIAVVPTGGQNAERNTALDRVTFQVLVRASSTGSTGLEAKVLAVNNALNHYGGTPIAGGARWLDTLKQGDDFYLGRDGNQRPMYSVNYLVYRERTT